MDKKIIITMIAAIVIVLLGIGGYFYWTKTRVQTPQEQSQQIIGETTDVLNQSVSQGVLPSVDTEQVNPLKNNPDINPVNKTNPFTDIKTNPFQ